MHHIVIISSSVRTGRDSHRVALYFKNYLESRKLAEVTLVDLMALDFPVFHERLRYQADPLPAVKHLAEQVGACDGVLIVTPEYNGGYPASLKNVTDLLYDEWKRKPVAISTVSSGPFGGSQVLTSLQFTLWKIGAWTVPAMFPVPHVDKSFDDAGVPGEKEQTDKRAGKFIDEWVWCMQAARKMK